MVSASLRFPALIAIAMLMADGSVMHAQAGSALSGNAGRAAEAAGLRSTAESLRDAGQRDSSLRLLNVALRSSIDIGDQSGEAEARRLIGTVGLMTGRAREALPPLQQALQMFRVLGDRESEGRTLSNIGIAYADLGRSDSAVAHYRAAIVIRRSIGDERGEGTTLNNLAYVFSITGQFDSASTTFREALRIARRLGFADDEARVLNGIGSLFKQSVQQDSAQHYFRLSAERFLDAGDRRSATGILVNLASVYQNRGELDSAEAMLRDALHALAGTDPEAEGFIHLSLSSVHERRGTADSALTSARRALALSRQTGSAQVATGAESKLGRLFMIANAPDSALPHLRAMRNLAQSTGDLSSASHALTSIGWVHQFLMNPQRPELARFFYDSASALQHQMLARTEDDQARLGRTETSSELYTAWAQAWLDSPKVDVFDRRYAALAVFERGRAQALLDLMRRTSANANELDLPRPSSAAYGNSIVAEGYRLRDAVGAQQSGMLVLMVLFNRVERYAITSNGGGSLEHVYITRDSLAALVSAARAGLGVDSAAARSVSGLDAVRGVVRAPSAGAGDAALRELGRLLISESSIANLQVRENRELLIVADGPLAMVPFAALPIDALGTPLGTKFAIRYAPSLTTALMLGSRRPAPQDGALVVGNPAMPEIPRQGAEPLTLSPLPGADTEAAWIAGRFSTSALRAGAATEAEVRRRMPSASVIHLATHGMAYSSAERARDSFLALGPDSDHDGLLTVGEVLDAVPALRADLVVLSACQTGLGNLRQAEGTVGLQRAFLAKGARSVLVSLWSVSDEATDLLMRRFYAEWLAGATKPEALRRAQVAVRGQRGSRFHHPRFWAAFQLVGAP